MEVIFSVGRHQRSGWPISSDRWKVPCRVRDLHPEAATYDGAAESLQTVWVAVRASPRSVLEKTTIADIVSGHLPRSIPALNADPDSWISRPARY